MGGIEECLKEFQRNRKQVWQVKVKEIVVFKLSITNAKPWNCDHKYMRGFMWWGEGFVFVSWKPNKSIVLNHRVIAGGCLNHK